MAITTTRSGFPTLQPAYIIKVNVSDTSHVGNLYTGSSLVHVAISSGSIKTVPDFEPQIDADITFGGNSLYLDSDKGHVRINLQGIAKTTESISIGFGYTGTVDVDKVLKSLFDGEPSVQTTAFGQSSTVHTFEAGDAKFRDLVNYAWVGNGRFVVENEKLTVEYRVSKLIPSRDID